MIRSKDNLISEERLAVSNLCQWDDIITKPANKGSTGVVLSKEEYIKQADHQLNNDAYYQKLSVNLIIQYMMEMEKFIVSLFKRGLID